MLADANEKGLVTQFTYGVLLARIPLFLFQAVQAALLPRLSQLAARNEIVEFREGLVRLLKMVLVVATVGTVGAYVIGPVVIEKFYGSQLSGNTLAVLAFSSAIYMLALALAQAVIALRGHKLVALGWATAGITFLLVTWLNSGAELFRRVEIGLVSSSAAALIMFGLALRHKLGAGGQQAGTLHGPAELVDHDARIHGKARDFRHALALTLRACSCAAQWSPEELSALARRRERLERKLSSPHRTGRALPRHNALKDPDSADR